MAEEVSLRETPSSTSDEYSTARSESFKELNCDIDSDRSITNDVEEKQIDNAADVTYNVDSANVLPNGTSSESAIPELNDIPGNGQSLNCNVNSNRSTTNDKQLDNGADLTYDIDSNDALSNGTSSETAKPEVIDVLGNGQLMKKVIKEGKEGTRPARLDLCVIDFTGRLQDGTIVEENTDFHFQLSDLEIIQGLDLAIALMNNEEQAEIEVNGRFAYGRIGRNEPLPEIPPDAKIIYNVTLKSSKMEDEINCISVNERRKIGNKKRERGNWWFSRDEPSLAIQCYRRALEYLSPSSNSSFEEEDQSTETVSDSDLQALLEDAIKVYNNLAAANMKIQAYDAALTSVENVLRSQPQNVKALFRKGKILHSKGEYSAATTTLLQALKVDPDNKAIKQVLMILKQKTEKDARNEKNLYRKMLGTAEPSKHKSSTDKNVKKRVPTKLTWSLLGGTMAAVVGLIVYKFVS